MAEKPKKKRWLLIVVLIIGLVMCVCVALRSVSLDTDDPPNMAKPPPGAVATPRPTEVPPTATYPPEAPPYAEIAGNLETMTEAQWKAYLPTLKGNMALNWRGWVADVDLGGNGVYTLLIDMDPPGTFLSTYDVSFEIPEADALGYEIGQEVRFSGTIERASEFLGSTTIRLEDAGVIAPPEADTKPEANPVEVQEYLEAVKALQEEYQDAFQIAGNPDTVDRGPAISDLQQMRRRLEQLEPPEPCQVIHQHVTDGMDYIIEGLLAFAAGDIPESNRLFGLGSESIDLVNDELRRLVAEYGD